MSEQNKLPALTQVNVEAQMNVALTQQSISIQKIQDEINGLVFNEDNLQAISDVIIRINKADKIIEDKFKEVKAPYLEAGRTCDAAKNSMLAINAGLRKQVIEPYNRLSAVVEKRRQDKIADENRKKNIKSGIESNTIMFSKQIAECDTTEKLLAVERLINLEKSESRQSKYMEFHDDAIAKYDEVLVPIIKDQKEKIKIREVVLKSIQQAEDSNDADKVDELKTKQDKIDNEIRQNQVDVQQKALSVLQSFESVTEVEEILPDTNPVHVIKFEIHDLVTAVKKVPELLNIELRFRDVQKISMTLKEAGSFKDRNEVIVNGIRYFIDQSFKALKK